MAPVSPDRSVVRRTLLHSAIVVGLVLIALFFVLEGPARWVGVVGLVALGTGLMNFCPLYSILGINTCPAGKR